MRVTLVLLTLVSPPFSVFAQPHEPLEEVEVALEPGAGTPPPTFFTRPQYRGTAVSLPVGNYALADLVAHGMADNTISSLRVAPGFKVEAFANGDFTGRSIIVSGDTPALTTRQFDNQLSSVRISQFSVGATFYEFCERGGYAVSLPAGRYTAQNLALWGIGDNAVSGVVPVRGKEVELFTRDSFKGASRLVNNATLCLPNGGLDNATSSLRIRHSPVVFRDTFNRGLSNWLPETGTWQARNGTMVGIGAGGDIDAWTYVSSIDSFDGSIVIDVDIEMTHGNVEIVFNSHGHWINEYRLNMWGNNGVAYRNQYQIVRYRNGEIEFTVGMPGDEMTPAPFPIPAKCHVTVRRINSTISIYINGRRLASLVDPDPLPASGKVGLGVSWDLRTTFDNFVVRK
jgi:hypothetical protein